MRIPTPQVLAGFPAEHDDVLLSLTGKTREYFQDRLERSERAKKMADVSPFEKEDEDRHKVSVRACVRAFPFATEFLRKSVGVQRHHTLRPLCIYGPARKRWGRAVRTLYLPVGSCRGSRHSARSEFLG